MKKTLLALFGISFLLSLSSVVLAQTMMLPGFSVSVFQSGLPSTPYEMTISQTSGSIFFSDYNSNGSLYKVSPGGTVTTLSTTWASNVGASFTYSDIELIGGFIYCHTNAGRIVKIDTTNGASTLDYTLAGASGYYNGATSIGTMYYSGEGNSTGGSIYSYNTVATTSSVLTASMPQQTFEGMEYCAATNTLYLGYTAYNAGVYSGYLTKVNTVTGILTNVASIKGNANFAVDPYGTFAYYYDGTMVQQVNLSNGETKNFISGLNTSTYYDMKFGPSSTGCGYSLYIGGNNSIFEVKGTGVAGNNTSICIGNWVQLSSGNWGNCTWTPSAGLDFTDNATPVATPVVTTVYTISNTNLCGTSVQNVTITVSSFTAPTVTLNAIDSLCYNAGLTVLNGGTPSGGVFSGVGVSAGSFNPGIGPGVHSVVYTYTDANSCTNRDTDVVVVTIPSTVTINLPPTFCELDAPFSLIGGSPAGGLYTGAGVSSNQFDPSIAGLGSHLITYHYSLGGCVDSASQSVNVISAPTSSLNPFSTVCPSADPFPLTGGSPFGGSYSGAGVADTTFFPGIAGPGSHPITYSYYDPATANYTMSQTGAFAPVSGTGTTVYLDDDTVKGPFPVGFHFNFYGINYTSFYISSNGFITFNPGTCGAACSDGQFMPTNNSNPSNMIAFAWGNLDPSTNGTVRYMTLGTAPNRKLVVKFVAIPYYFSTNPYVTTMAVMYEGTNIIEFHTTSVNSFLTMTMGIMNNGGTNAVVVPGRNAVSWGSVTHDYVKFTPVNGCVSTSLQTIDVLPYPAVNAGSDVTIGLGESTTLSGTVGSSTFSWSPITGLDNPNSATPIATPSASTSYILTVTDGSGCKANDTIKVTVVDYTGITSIESGKSLILNAYPNPYSTSLTVEVSLSGESDMLFSVTDIYGRMVKQFSRKGIQGGNSKIKIEQECLPEKDGIYFLEIRVNNKHTGKESISYCKITSLH